MLYENALLIHHYRGPPSPLEKAWEKQISTHQQTPIYLSNLIIVGYTNKSCLYKHRLLPVGASRPIIARRGFSARQKAGTSITASPCLFISF